MGTKTERMTIAMRDIHEIANSSRHDTPPKIEHLLNDLSDIAAISKSYAADRGPSTEVLESLRALTEWAREHTSPLDANSPHEILIRAVAALDEADKQKAESPGVNEALAKDHMNQIEDVIVNQYGEDDEPFTKTALRETLDAIVAVTDDYTRKSEQAAQAVQAEATAPVRVVIEVSDGGVLGVTATQPTEFVVVDYDYEDADDAIEIDDQKPSATREDVEVDAAKVEGIFAQLPEAKQPTAN